MITQVTGTVVVKDLDRVEVLTPGGLAYEISIPLSVFERLPEAGKPATLHTHLVVREDGWELYGFSAPHERQVFRRLLAAKGVGPALALGLISTLTADGVVRAIRDKDVATLTGVPRVGKKKAQQLVLDLGDKLDDLAAPGTPRAMGGGATTDDALRALVSLGYSTAEAERGVRAALDGGATGGATELIRAALAELSRR
ncbi:MAG: Holliday junction branch migration protein RuvA [Gemmatimonadaceae bacterium]|nr:Holliday junction branch migration protein RuvA [Gemmatimonadaceae bacterium]